MSAKHPTPWTVINCNNGARGKLRHEWGNIADNNGIFIVEGEDLATAREIAEAVNGRAALRDLVRRPYGGKRIRPPTVQEISENEMLREDNAKMRAELALLPLDQKAALAEASRRANTGTAREFWGIIADLLSDQNAGWEYLAEAKAEIARHKRRIEQLLDDSEARYAENKALRDMVARLCKALDGKPEGGNLVAEARKLLGGAE